MLKLDESSGFAYGLPGVRNVVSNERDAKDDHPEGQKVVVDRAANVSGSRVTQAVKLRIG
ncbi:MAG: hypothetical protein M3365_07815 [Gemmatimonadota bacterium]|nr:hypothetical protein [Gemmatimonadota bacterium]